MEVTGTFNRFGTIESGVAEKTGNTWQKQKIFIQYGNEYIRDLAFDVFGEDKIKGLPPMEQGDTVLVKFFPVTREYNDKYFTDMGFQSVIITQKGFGNNGTVAQPVATAAAPAVPQAPAPAVNESDEVDDDLPF